MQTNDNIATQHVLLNLVRGLYKALDDDWRKSATQCGITVSQQHLLWIVFFDDGSTLSEISQHGIWHLSTVMDLVDRMKKAGLVNKKIDQKDARTKRVYITDKGTEILKSSFENLAHFKFTDVLSDHFNETELLNNIDILYKLNKALHGENFVEYVKKSSAKIKASASYNKI